MVIIVDESDSIDHITFHSDMHGNLIPFYDGELFTGTIIDNHGELEYNCGELIKVVEYNGRVLH